MNNASRKKVVLIVDDEPDICEIMAFDIEDAGYEVVIAHSAKEALHVVESRPTDVVVSDICMPGVSGVEFLEWVKERGMIKPVVIFVSAHSQIDLEDIYAKGAEGLFSKPIKPYLLLDALQSILTPGESKWQENNVRSAAPQVELLATSDKQAEKMKILHVGRGGAFIALPSDMLPAVGTSVKFRLPFAEKGFDYLEGNGIVRWSRRSPTDKYPTGVGIEFRNLSEVCRNKLLQWIDMVNMKAFIPKT